MKKLLVVLLLALAVCAGAVELYWDDDLTGGYKINSGGYYVLFRDEEQKPGSTMGQEGIVSAFRISFYTPFAEGLIWLYITSCGDDDNPDRILYGNIPFDWELVGDWHILTFREPVEVPGKFFAGFACGWAGVYNAPYEDTTHDWDFNHSRYGAGAGDWRALDSDFRIRVEWVPKDQAPPYVDELNPEDGEADVPLDSNIVFHCKNDYSRIDLDTIDFKARDTSLGGGRALRVVYEPTRTIAGKLDIDDTDPKDVICIFTPYDDLPVDLITCTVDGGLADWWGNEMGEDFIWSFTTEGYVSIEETTWGRIKAGN